MYWGKYIALSISFIVLIQANHGFTDQIEPLERDLVQVNLLERYPTNLGEDQSGQKLAWTFSEADIYSLSGFELNIGEKLRMKLGPSALGIGRSDEGAVWAVVIPNEAGTLNSESVKETESVTNVWLRFHPMTITTLFPPDTVLSSGNPTLQSRMRRIAHWKFRTSWKAGSLAVVPPLETIFADVDTQDKKRRLYSIDKKDSSVKYYPSSSDPTPFHPITPAEAEASFDQLWNEYDRNYAMFVLRPEVNWDELREQYRPKALQCEYAFEFAKVCAEMLAHLRDLHIWVRMGEESVPVFSRPRPGNANPKAIATVLGELKKEGNRVAWAITDDKIGYIAVYGWDDQNIPKQVDSVLDQMTDTRGIIFDVRLNGGGGEPLGQAVAGRFTDQEAVYSYHQYRAGPKHEDLTEKIPRRFGPRGEWLYDRPVVLLIGQRCLSSNEAFAAMMDQCPQVTLMGDHTGGSSGNPKMIDLPAGVQVSLPRWLSLLVDEKPLDERGIQPDILIETDRQSLKEDDPVFKAALNHLRKVPLPEKPIVVIEPELPATAQIKDGTPGDEPEKSKKTPHVLMLDPLFGATDVSPQTEILVNFDRPMNTDRLTLNWSAGGFRNVGRIGWYEDMFQFIIPIYLEPGCSHKVSVPPGGFWSKEGGKSAKMEWSYQTSALEPDEGSSRPQLVKILPATGTEIARVSLVRFQFDSHIAPYSIAMRDTGNPSNRQAAWCAKNQYDEESMTLCVPVYFPPGWEGTFQVTSMQSLAGKRVDPINLTYTTNEEPFSEELRRRFQKARKSEEIRSLLSSMKRARGSLYSFEETVHRQLSSVMQSSGYTYLRADSARFLVQGSTQFIADISNCMGLPFTVGSTGNRYWYHEKSEKEFLKGLDLNEVQEAEFRFADPFHLLNREVETVMNEENLEYAGTQETAGGPAHVLRAWRFVERNGQEHLCIDEYWIDSKSFLPVRFQRTSSEGSELTLTYQFDRINEEFPTTLFAPISVTSVPLVLEEPLGEGFENRFVFIQDGCNGDFRVEWGKSGPDSFTSIGLN